MPNGDATIDMSIYFKVIKVKNGIINVHACVCLHEHVHENGSNHRDDGNDRFFLMWHIKQTIQIPKLQT
jgi:hypothetical protein